MRPLTTRSGGRLDRRLLIHAPHSPAKAPCPVPILLSEGALGGIFNRKDAYGALKFEGQPLGITSTQKVFTRAKARAGIDKNGCRRSGL